MNVREFLESARAALDADVRFVWVDDYAFLREHRIEEAIPWAMLAGNDDGMMSIRNERAVSAGLTFRPLAATVRDTLAWWPSVPEARRTSPRFAITPDQEARALAAWKARPSPS
jgi:2'-hydroxyisoflavone reductase